MKIGLDTYIEMDYQTALKFIEEKISFLSKKREILTEQIIKNKAYYKYTHSVIEQIKNI
jgi:prefoldin subunit 5